MKKITLILSALLVLSFSVRATSKPNIIIIINDDQGYQDLGCYGSPDIRTPRADQLAKEGMRFTDFYMASSVCSASRAALLTGCYPKRVGVERVYWPNKAGGLDPKLTTIAEVLKNVGYSTKAVGKWHLGDEVQYLPTNQGFDSYYGIPYSNDMYPSHAMTYAPDCTFREGITKEKLDSVYNPENRFKFPGAYKNKVPLMRDSVCIEMPVDQSTITQRYATESIQFITESVNQEKPFFLYLANSMPHVPLYASPEFKGKSKRGLYGDVIEEIDYNIGRIVDHLKQLNIDKNTIIIITSDNGPWLVKGDQGGSAYPLFEGKMTQFEGGQRVPTIIKWAGNVPASTVCNTMVLSMDLLPTLAHITGASLPQNTSLDGANVINVLKGVEATTPHDYFYYDNTAVRSGHWKYHRKEVFKVEATKRPDKGPTLYNLKQDIGESKNVIDDYPEVAKRLAKALSNNPNVQQKGH